MLTVQNIAHTYPARRTTGTHALRGVSLSAEAGRVTAVVGPNGSGKTTLFRLITGVLARQQGSITLNGSSPRNARIGVVFQSPSLDPHLTAFENIRHHAMLYGRRIGRKDIPAALLERLGIADMLDTRISALSGGYQRRVELAKALLTDPELLVLDEPFTGLDVSARESFFSLLRDVTIQRELITVLVTHVLSLATQCDRVVALEQGTVIADDRPDRLLEDFGSTVVEITTDDPDALSARIGANGGPNLLQLRENALLLLHTGLRNVAAIVDADDPLVHDIQVRRPTLEDFFIARTGHGVARTGEELLAA